jgi:hypothetical protein
VSTRLTEQWTETTAEAFGNSNSVRKGYKAEIMYYKYASQIYDRVEHFPSNKQRQLEGCDIALHRELWSRPYTVDVKGNLTKDGTFFVDCSESGGILDPRKTNDRICHIDVDSGWAFEYDRNHMIHFVRKDGLIGRLVPFNVFTSTFPFKTRKFKMETVNDKP